MVHPAERYALVRARTDALTAPLSAEDCAVQSLPEASPVKWHLAHTTWLFEHFVLSACEPQVAVHDPRFVALFSAPSGVSGGCRAHGRHRTLSRPSLEEIRAYRAAVDERMRRVFAVGALTTPLMDAVERCIQHEERHQELILTDVKHLLWKNPLKPAYDARAPGPLSLIDTPTWISHPAGLYLIGHGSEGFAFDNERPRHRAFVEAFTLRSRLVTAGEYMEFIRDGGYRRPILWQAEGWALAQREGWTGPLYWEEDGRTFTLRGLVALEPHEPLYHVSYYEADAFARWAGARLPTELEWEVGAQAHRPAQMTNVVWQWTSSAHAPYPGFSPAQGPMSGHEGRFMCNQYVLRGGSYATPPGHVRDTYRHFLSAGTRWQFTGIRLARDAKC